MQTIPEALREMADDIEQEQVRLRLLFRLTSQFLEEYADRLSNDGCNDWQWPEYLTLAKCPERVTVQDIMEIEEMLKGDEFAGEKLVPNNFAVKNLAKCFGKMAQPG